MAKQFGSQIDLQKIPVLNIVMENKSTAQQPSAPTNGQLYYDTTLNKGRLFEAGSWVDIFSTAAAGGPAGGDLTGTYPNPTLANLVVTATKIANATITDAQIATTNKDGAAATPSLRTLGTGATQAVSGTDARLTDARTPTAHATSHQAGGSDAMAIDAVAATGSLRTLGTGAQQALAGTTRLDQIAAPTANVNMNGWRLVNLLDPGSPQEPATKAYVDAAIQGLDTHNSVLCATTANVGLTGLAAIDGITPLNGSRVLVKNQTITSQNGIWQTSSGAWARAADADVTGDIQPGTFVFVEQGTTQADSGWVMIGDSIPNLGTDPVVWAQFSGAGSIINGSGITKSGNTISVDTSVIAALASPTFTGDPKAPTPAPGDSDTSIATTAFVTGGITTATSGKADKTVTVTGTGGLTGGGDLSANRTLDISASYLGQTSITTLGTITTGSWNGTPIPMSKGGTGGTDAATARTSLGAVGKNSVSLGALSAGVETTFAHNLNTKDIVPSFRLVSTDRGIDLDWRAVDANTIGVTADVAYTASTVRCVVMG